MIENNKVYLCSINNIESGTCNEDCKFCTQSVRYKAKINRYKRKSIEDIIAEAKLAISFGATGYCLVTAGLGLDDEKVNFLCKTAKMIKSDLPDINLIACNGIATIAQLSKLKESGFDGYNHNLEASKEYYSKVCSTHTWEERYETCQNVNKSGLNLICGGIFGMGESYDDRISMINSIASLKPKTVPLNFFHPNEDLPFTRNTIDVKTAFEIIKISKSIINPKKLMVAGGRENIFKDEQYDIFKYGANAIIVGDYLTTNGNKASSDIKNIQKLGLTISKTCD